MDKNKKIAAHTLGCKVNAYDTEAMLELFLNKNYEIVDFDDIADIYIINTCTVTNLGDKKSRQMIRKARKRNPSATIVATGCYAQVNPSELEKIDELNLIIGTKDRSTIVERVENYNVSHGIINKVSNIMDEKIFENLSINKLHGKTRAFLKIQEGCNQYCTYCIIPYARGNIRSRDPLDILDETKVLANNGIKEIVLTGIHVASYGKDLDNINLLKVLEMVHKVEGIERIRFSSVDPTIVTNEFVEKIKTMNKICNHFHLSLQSGCNRTLKRMNRRYTAEQYEDAVNLLRQNFQDVSITTDIIVGFPDETEQDFWESYHFIEKLKLPYLHIFPYSPKKGTRASTFENQVPAEVKEMRSKEMIKLSNILNLEFREQHINRELEVLFEQLIDEDTYEGHTTNYIKVQTRSSNNIINKICKVKPTCINQDALASILLQ